MTSTTFNDFEQQSELNRAYGDYGKRLTLHAFFKVHDLAMSEDLVQDTFLKTWAYLHKGGTIAVMKAFLYHILNNLIIDQYRRAKTVSLDSIIEQGFEPGIDEKERLFDHLDGERALALIDCLPPSYQSVMRMRYLDNLSLSEMAEQTGQSRNTTAVQLHRGLVKLRELYLSAHPSPTVLPDT